MERWRFPGHRSCGNNRPKPVLVPNATLLPASGSPFRSSAEAEAGRSLFTIMSWCARIHELYVLRSHAFSPLKKLLLVFLLLIFAPIAASAARYLWIGDGRGNWQTADRSSAGLLPPATAHPEAVVRVFAARTVWWRGILLWRKAATKVIVSHDPSGTAPITLTPLGARPLSRTRFVLTAVSSIKTSRAGSRKPCSRIQRRRARATSSRCRSVACRLFFKGDVVTIEKTPERAAAGSNSPLAQLCKRLHQRQVRMLGNHSQNLGRELFEWRNASAARLRSGAVIVPPALQPLDR